MLLLGVAIGFVVGYLLVVYFRRPKTVKNPTSIEFWVYLPASEMPTQNEIMADLANAPALPQGDLLLLSDIRFHVALATREKNLEYFRPDLLDPFVEPTAETLRCLSEAKAFARVSFVSEAPVADDRHLRLVPYYAFAIAKRGGALLLLDVNASRLITAAEFEQLILQDRRLSDLLSQVKIVWQAGELGGAVRTRGFGKRGWPDLRTLPVGNDQRILVLEVMEQACRKIWNEAVLPANLTVEAFGDQFTLELGSTEEETRTVRIGRIHPLLP